MSSSDPVRAQLTAARRTQILDAATQVFAARGFHRTTIRDVARAAGVADGTIYNYFAGKDDLLFGLLDRLNETERRAGAFADGLDGGDVRAFFRAYVRHRLAVVRADAEVFRAALPEILVNADLRARYVAAFVTPTARLAEDFFRTLMDAGRVRPVDVPLTVRAVAGTVTGLLVLYLLGDETVADRWDALPDTLTALLFDGLIPDDGALDAEPSPRGA